MRLIDIIRLLCLSAIWGGSFIFMRIIAPVMGAIPTANSRVLIAGIVLALYFSLTKFKADWKKNGRQYLIIGIIGSGIPFALFAFAALSIPASYEVILNSTSPLFGALFSWLWLNEKMTLQKTLGLIASAFGVGIVVNIGASKIELHFILAVIACLGAAICYALAGLYIKKQANHLHPLAISGGSQLMVGLFMLPLSALSVSAQPIYMEYLLNVKVLGSLLGLGLICSMLAYILYYQLMADIGPTKALTVTFLMPIFGIVWGKIFLNEIITLQMIFGTIIILIGTYLVLTQPFIFSRARSNI